MNGELTSHDERWKHNLTFSTYVVLTRNTEVSTFPVILQKVSFLFFLGRNVNLPDGLHYALQLTFFRTKSSSLMNWTHRFRRGDNKQISWSRIKASVSTFGTDFGPVHGKFRFFVPFTEKEGSLTPWGSGLASGSRRNAIPGEKKPGRHLQGTSKGEGMRIIFICFVFIRRIPPAGWMGVELFLSYWDFLFIYLFFFRCVK